MPRFFFHVMDGRAIIDTVGVELAGVTEARAEAVRAAGTILSSEATKFLEGRGRWCMSVADETGAVCFTLRFSGDNHED